MKYLKCCCRDYYAYDYSNAMCPNPKALLPRALTLSEIQCLHFFHMLLSLPKCPSLSDPSRKSPLILQESAGAGPILPDTLSGRVHRTPMLTACPGPCTYVRQR